MSHVIVQSTGEADALMEVVRSSAARAVKAIAALNAEPLDTLKRMKFDQLGFHPLEDRPLNLIEQVNQTWTYAVAIAAARQLLVLHPDVGGFRLAPGAHASLKLDVMSVDGQVGAETFAAVDPRNNDKLARDLAKLASSPEVAHRYVFFMSPRMPGNKRWPNLESDGIQVWSIDL